MRTFHKIPSTRNMKQIIKLPANIRGFAQKAQNSGKYDLVVVGGGIIGTGSAKVFKERHPNLEMAVLEKEDQLGQHQTGHNSGVIHAGIYYTPGSLKAKLCVEGLKLAYRYCEEKNIPHKKAGKLIVATNEVEAKRLIGLYERGLENKVPNLALIEGNDQIRKIEPHCEGLAAIYSPETGIVDWKTVAEHYGKDFVEKGGKIHLKFEVNGFKPSGDPEYPVLITARSRGTVQAKYVLCCAGLYSDKIARLSGCSSDPKIIPFRGEYLQLIPQKSHLVKGNIYPVPDPRFPFLGVHFTPRLDGSIWLGPNAVLAYKREGYKWYNFNLLEFLDAVFYIGTIRLAWGYVIPGTYEMIKSWIVSLQVKELQKFIPEIQTSDVMPGASGVRAQAVDYAGNMVDDFYFDLHKGDKKGIGERVLHCRNAPSPGATSSLAIARMIANKLEKQFGLK